MIPRFMSGNSRMMGLPPFTIPILTPPAFYPPGNVNMYPSSAMTNEYDSFSYGRFQHVERNYPQYRHVPFDWYRPPYQRYDVIHEDVAIMTVDGPVPIDDFYRYYIYGEDTDDSDGSSFSDRSSYTFSK